MIDLGSAQKYLRDHALHGWLLYDFEQANPIFWEILGTPSHVTRPCILFIPASGIPTLLVHQVDAGKFAGLSANIVVYLGRIEMQRRLGDLLHVGEKVAMEYSSLGELPIISRVDAGTIELIRAVGATVVSSANVIQHTIASLDQAQMALHLSAARKLDRLVHEAFGYIGNNLATGIAESDVADHILQRLAQENLVTDGGPVVAVNEHSADPHYEPSSANRRVIQSGDWVLIDLWAKEDQASAVYGDITWVAYVGRDVPEEHRKAFEVVARARDLALSFLRETYDRGESPEGWQVDECARNFITNHGYGQYFTHRLGHSLGKTVHSYAVNLDSFETRDTRAIVPGIAFTIEPGLYLPQFGVRSEINVVMSDRGPVLTTPAQDKVVLIS
ncbi:MAG: M24 family metallopeptidase [Chloroflexi bacterium]|nr:M24 family metallopeptidase [Chloroflexota bacterium]